MARCTLTIEIQAPVEIVWNVTQDPSRRPEWDYRVKKSQLIDSDYPGKAVRFRTEGSMLGRFCLDMEYVTFEVNRRSAVKLISASGMPFVSGGGSWRYEKLGEDRCLFQTTVQMNPAQSLLSTFMDTYFLEPLLIRMTKKSLRALKAVAEADFRRQQNEATATSIGGANLCTQR